MKKNMICLWYDRRRKKPHTFYARTFPDSSVGAVRVPSDFPGGKAGDVQTVEFTVGGVPCFGRDGVDVFKHSEAFSFQIATEDQAETDRYLKQESFWIHHPNFGILPACPVSSFESHIYQ